MSVAWIGCENAPDPGDQSPLGPVFAKGGPECDTKAAPVREYFLDKTTQQEVDELFRALATGCADGDGFATLNSGFDILEKVEATREMPAVAGDAADGAMVASTVVGIMNYVCGLLSDCDPSAVLSDGVLEGALGAGGAFGVVAASGTSRVPTYGSSPYWFIEPFKTSSSWGNDLPGNRVLVVGAPTVENPLPRETQLNLGGSFSLDWNVLYFKMDGLNDLSVTMCETAAEGGKEKIAHGGALLQEGNYYPPDADHPCYFFEANDPLVTSGLTASLGRLAAAALPFWPQPLLAGFTGGSASGKATEFSPFSGYEIDPVGLVEFITKPADSRVLEPIVCMDEVEGYVCPDNKAILVHLTTSNGSKLSGDEMVYIRITAEDNNGSWNLLGDPVGKKVSVDGYGLVYSWTGLNLDKPGAYKLHTYYTDADGCPFADDGTPLTDANGIAIACGENTVGIAFPAASSEKFIVNP